jgi:hypothetical protein
MTRQRTNPITRGRLTGLGLLDSLDLGVVLAYPLEFGRDLVIRWIVAFHLEVDYNLYQRRIGTMRLSPTGIRLGMYRSLGRPERDTRGRREGRERTRNDECWTGGGRGVHINIRRSDSPHIKSLIVYASNTSIFARSSGESDESVSSHGLDSRGANAASTEAIEAESEADTEDASNSDEVMLGVVAVCWMRVEEIAELVVGYGYGYCYRISRDDAGRVIC